MTVDTSFARRFIDVEREEKRGRTWQQVLAVWFLPAHHHAPRKSNPGNRLFGVSNRHWMLFFLIWMRPHHKRNHRR